MASRDHSLFPSLTRPRTIALGLVLLVSSCASSESTAPVTTDLVTAPAAASSSQDTNDGTFPDVIDATATNQGDGAWTFAVTISSPYDSPDRYADAWRVLGPSGTELGLRILTHDHAAEQPFTRSQSGIVIPGDVEVVTIQGRDLVNGWGGATFDVELPPSS